MSITYVDYAGSEGDYTIVTIVRQDLDGREEILDMARLSRERSYKIPAPWDEDCPECPVFSSRSHHKHCDHHEEDGDPCCKCKRKHWQANWIADKLDWVRGCNRIEGEQNGHYSL